MSDVVEGRLSEEAGFAAEMDMDFAGEAAPEILVEGGDELRLLDFFAPRLWAVALLPLVFTAVTSNLSAVRVSDAISPLGRGTPYEDLFFQAPSIPFYARHLLPFGLPLTTDTGYGYGLTNILQSNMLIGLLALLVASLLVAAVTRRTNDAIYVAGPYCVLSVLTIFMLWRGGTYFQTWSDTFTALLGALLAPLLIGLIAKVVATAMRNQGWLEADYATAGTGGMDRGSEWDAVPVSPSGPSVGVPAIADGPVPADGTAPRHVTLALACPFCGNPKLSNPPRSCNRCHRNVGLAIEHDELACGYCGGALVLGAEFCHHCSKWQHGEPLSEELEVA